MVAGGGNYFWKVGNFQWPRSFTEFMIYVESLMRGTGEALSK